MATQHGQVRPRSKSALSFGSTRSHKSNGSGGNRIDLTESAKEKSARRMTGSSKADPSVAMNEAQPAARQLEHSTLESLRSIQYRDAQGNIITDPDRSNPTRPRLERPLDTIRSFEAAIDGSYNRRYSTRLEPKDSVKTQNRRSSYYQGFNNHSLPQRFPGDDGGYYGNRMSYMPVTRPESYADNSGNQVGQYAPPRKFGPRTQSDPMLYGQHSQEVYPTNGYQQSYDTVTSGTGSHGTDQWGNSTDPSSENSSIDKIQQASKPDLAETYRFNGFGGGIQLQGPILEEHGRGAPTYGQLGYGQSPTSPGTSKAYQGNIAPPPPPHAPPKDRAPRVPIKLGSPAKIPTYTIGQVAKGRTDKGEKRQSWLKRTFSKKA